jgi:hypothetical protein
MPDNDLMGTETGWVCYFKVNNSKDYKRLFGCEEY